MGMLIRHYEAKIATAARMDRQMKPNTSSNVNGCSRLPVSRRRRVLRNMKSENNSNSPAVMHDIRVRHRFARGSFNGTLVSFVSLSLSLCLPVSLRQTVPEIAATLSEVLTPRREERGPQQQQSNSKVSNPKLCLLATMLGPCRANIQAVVLSGRNDVERRIEEYSMARLTSRRSATSPWSRV